jgi:hypothetical protein
VCCVGYSSSSTGDGHLMHHIPHIVGLVGVVIQHDICGGIGFLSPLVMYLIKFSITHSITTVQFNLKFDIFSSNNKIRSLY